MKVNDIIVGKVFKIEKTHLIVLINKKYIGIVHISDISDFYIKNLNSLFDLNSKYEFQIIEINEKNKKINLSWKLIHPLFLQNPFSYKIKETIFGFKNLIKNTNKKIKDKKF